MIGTISSSPHITCAMTSFTDHFPAAPGSGIRPSPTRASSAFHSARVSLSVLMNVALSIVSSFRSLKHQLYFLRLVYHEKGTDSDRFLPRKSAVEYLNAYNIKLKDNRAYNQ